MSQLKLNLKSVNDDLVIDLFPLGFRADDSSLNCQGRLKRDLETVMCPIDLTPEMAQARFLFSSKCFCKFLTVSNLYINLYFFFIINNCKSLRNLSKMHVIYPIVITKYDIYMHVPKKKKVARKVISRNSIHLITILISQTYYINVNNVRHIT